MWAPQGALGDITHVPCCWEVTHTTWKCLEEREGGREREKETLREADVQTGGWRGIRGVQVGFIEGQTDDKLDHHRWPPHLGPMGDE